MVRLTVTTQHLEYLLAIDRSDTWADAADAVGVSPSALSQGIAELERRLGVSLFERDGRRRVPSRDHPEVLRYAEQTISATRDLARWLELRRTGRTGTIRIGLIDTAATHHFRDPLHRFRLDRPDVELRLTVAPSGSLLAALARAELDLAVCVRPPVTPVGVALTPLLDDPLTVLAPAGTSRRVPRWGPWVTFPVGSHTRATVEAAVRSAGHPFDVVADSHQPEVLLEMVRLGIGWTVLPTAGLGDLDDVVVIRDRIATRRLVVARRTGVAHDPLGDDLEARLVASLATVRA